MPHVLMLLSSPRGDASLSNKIATALTERMKHELNATITVRDLAAEPLPHINPDYVFGRMLRPEEQTPDQARAATLAGALVDELTAADVIVIAASMINFGPSSTLKTWVDYIVWPGRTMIPTKTGPQGMVTGKKVFLVAASGGIYSDGPMAANDMLVPYMKQILAFIGITDFEVIRVEGQSFGPEAAQKGFEDGMAQAGAMRLA